MDEEKFWAVQNLMEKNCRTKHNHVKPVKHNYILNGELLWCEKCGGEMEGRSGTGKLGLRYYYYRCKNLECKFKVPADEIEHVVVERIKILASQDNIIDDIITDTSKKLQKSYPN